MAPSSKKVLLVAPPFTPVSKNSVAGIEQMIYLLGKSLHEQGYNVSTIAREDSEVYGELIPGGKRTANAFPGADLEHFDQAMTYTQAVIRREIKKGEIDMIIDKCQGKSLITSIEENGPRVISSLDLESKYFIHPEYFGELKEEIKKREDTFAAVANHIGEELKETHLGEELSDRMSVIYNGINTNDYSASGCPEDYVLFLGRMREGKGPHIAIEAAQKAGCNIIVAGGNKSGDSNGQYEDSDYFNNKIKPLLDDSVTWFGPANLEQKVKLMKNAKAILFTSTHKEAQPLVVLESMASGTPVIALDKSIGPREIIEDGKTGYLVGSMGEMAERISSLDQLDRQEIRANAVENFDYTKMGEGYAKLIERK